MNQALTFLLGTLLNLYIGIFFLRLILQYVRADYRNPVSQFIVRVTNPLVTPLRRNIPPIGNIDTATLLVLITLEVLATILLVSLDCGQAPNVIQVIQIAVLRLVYLMLRVYLFAIAIHAILSWVSPGAYSPVSSLLATIVTPVLAPIRKLIPPIGGFDLSVLFAFIAIQFLTILLPIENVMAGLLCRSPYLIF